ncbi:MAG: hypothetical protein KBE25_04785 [Laribacter sp.]|nr:hypothetical protein [Laribacter sp.]MBP9527611.1 hypothetical protein [Laribacter sp.]MBP9608650.1 hypothetical protein [Laribacter sp.]
MTHPAFLIGSSLLLLAAVGPVLADSIGPSPSADQNFVITRDVPDHVAYRPVAPGQVTADANLAQSTDGTALIAPVATLIASDQILGSASRSDAPLGILTGQMDSIGSLIATPMAGGNLLAGGGITPAGTARIATSPVSAMTQGLGSLGSLLGGKGN